MNGLWEGIAWDDLVDPSLPPGVIAVQDSEGNWWRYPLVEFTGDAGPE